MTGKQSQKLFNLPILLLITAVLIAFLALLFPWKSVDFLNSQDSGNLKEQFSSRLLAEYHEALRTPDKDSQSVLTLASKLSKKGLWKQSGDLLSAKLNLQEVTAKEKKQLSTIQLKNYLDSYYTASAAGEDFTGEQIDVRQHLQDLEDFRDLSNKELVALAKISTNFGLLPQAVKIYTRLSETDPTRQAKWLAEAGRWSVHAGDPVSAASVFRTASELVTGSERYNVYTYAWLKAATKAGQTEAVKAFLERAQYQPPRSVKALTLLANSSLDAGLPENASDLFAHLAKQDKPENAQRWLEKAAHWAAETKSYAKAVHYLKQAHALTSATTDHWAINQRMIEIYVKDDQPDEALALIAPMIEANPESISLLKKGVELSLLEKDVPSARRWNQRILQQQPKSKDALIARTDIETIDENFGKAITYVKRAIKLDPKDYKLRERWAYLEETQGNEALALQLWQWMHGQTKDPKYQGQIIRMAQADLDGDGLRLLLSLSHQIELPKQAVNDIFFHLSKQEDGEAGEQFLTEYLVEHGPDKKLMETLAEWYGSKERYADALAFWDKIAQRYGEDKKHDLLRFELHWALEHKEKAYQLWLEHRPKWDVIATPNQVAIMAEVTWTHEQNQASLTYYKQLLKLSKVGEAEKRVLYHTRIAILHSKLNQTTLALDAFKRGFMETSNPDLMLSGLQATFDNKDYRGFSELLALSKEQETLFNTKPRYWLMQASIATQQLQYTKATQLYNKVLALDPDSLAALEGLKAIKVVMADTKKQEILKQIVAMQNAFDQKDFKRLAALLHASDEQINKFSSFAQYWTLKSQFSFQQKQFTQALRQYQQLIKLKPESIPARQGIILSLTQLKDFSTLQRALNAWEKIAENNYALWPNYAIAYQAMKQYQASIKWFEMASIKHPENYTMLLSYAESLDQLKRTEEAKKVRLFGVQQLTKKLNSNTFNPEERKEALFQYLSALSKIGTQAQFDQIYAELDRTTQQPSDKNRLNEIAIAWALDKNNLPQLKRLLARADVRRMKKPLWMSLSIALKLKDKAGLREVLKRANELSTGDHITVLLALGNEQKAFEVAKYAMKHGETPENRSNARKIALSLANGRVSEVIAALQDRRIGGLSISEQSLQYKQGKGTNNLPLGYDIKLRKARLSDNNRSGKAINEKDVSVGFDWSKSTHRLNGRAGVYDSDLGTKVYGSLKYQKQLGSNANAAIEYGFNETPEENAYLRQYGRRNRLKIDHYRQFGKKQAMQLSAWQHEFKRTDNGNFIADGIGARVALVHRENTVNGQWFGGIQGTIQKNSNATNIDSDSALPENSQSAELIAGFNHGTPGQGFAGDLQYSGSVSLGKVWPTGEIKAHAEAAVSKELFSNDELSLGVFYDKGSLGEQDDKGLTLKYRKFLDFPVTESKR